MSAALYLTLAFLFIWAGTESLVWALIGVYTVLTIVRETEKGLEQEKAKGSITTERGATIYRFVMQGIITVIISYFLISCGPLFIG
ncbi:MAG: hypothetical protein M1363_01195 [Gammaproteobacteria bacterium]|nr:hypothetical protein [Gammaproteobacteria bacterium]MCL5254736.1 hypothetical protein [Gammaproteobacteria bacterium]